MYDRFYSDSKIKLNGRKIIRIISDVLEVQESQISIKTSIGDVPEWDSIKQMQIIIALEEEYSVEFSENDLVEANNVKKLCQYISSLIEG